MGGLFMKYFQKIPNPTPRTEGSIRLRGCLREILIRQQLIAERFQRSTGTICPWVFHRQGAPIKSFADAWRTACTRAGCPGKIPHDLRRTAVRNLIRAGITESLAMTLTGHQTRSVFDRYNIISSRDLQDAATLLNKRHRRQQSYG
jgi:integrase